MWFVQGGIERKFIPLGKTTAFGEYRQDDVWPVQVARTGSELNFWAAGVVQNIDVAHHLYVIYRNASGDATTGGVNQELDHYLNMVIAGARIQF